MFGKDTSFLRGSYHVRYDKNTAMNNDNYCKCCYVLLKMADHDEYFCKLSTLVIFK